MRFTGNEKALIIGAGPSLERFKHLELAKKFKGIIISTDFMLKHCIKAGVIPNYVCTSESNLKILTFFVRDGVHTYHGNPDDLDKYAKNVICVISRKTRQEVKDVIESRKFKEIITCNDEEINNSSNIGLFCWKYAWYYLGCKEIVLIGFDHAHAEGFKPVIDPGNGCFVPVTHPVFGTTQLMDPNFQLFRTEFVKRAATKPCITVNATEGGSLFGDGIECMKFGDYLATRN